MSTQYYKGLIVQWNKITLIGNLNYSKRQHIRLDEQLINAVNMKKISENPKVLN